MKHVNHKDIKLSFFIVWHKQSYLIVSKENITVDNMFLEIFSYLKNFSSVTAVTEDLLLKCYSMTTFILLFMSILVTG